MTIPTFLATPSFMEGLMLLLTYQRGALTGPEPRQDHVRSEQTPALPSLPPDATTYAHFLFNAFDADGNGAIHFEVGPADLYVLPLRSPEWSPQNTRGLLTVG